MIWECDCGEVNLGVAKQCRQCGKAFSTDLIIGKKTETEELKSKTTDLKSNKSKPENTTAGDIAKYFFFSTMLSVILLSVLKLIFGESLFVSSVSDVLGTALSVWVAYLFVCNKYGKTFKQGFATNALSKRDVIEVSIVALILAASIMTITLFVESKTDRFDEIMAETFSTIPTIVLFFIGAIIVAPIAEEIVYRGLIFSVADRELSRKWHYVFQFVLFAGIHSYQYYPNWIVIANCGLVGFIATHMRYRYNSIYPSIFLHMIYNTSVLLPIIIQMIIK